MLRINRLFEVANETDRRRLTAAQDLFRKIFTREPEYADRVEALVMKKAALDYDTVILTAEDGRGRMLGLAVVHAYPEIRACFLDYIGSDPEARGRGLGRALYEAVRDYAIGKRAKGLFFEVPPNDPAICADANERRTRTARIRFYAGFGAYPILGTRYESPPVRFDYDPPYLCFDPLGAAPVLKRAFAKKAAARILTTRYGFPPEHEQVRTIVESIKDEPVRLRTPEAEAPVPAPAAPKRLRPLKVLLSERHDMLHIRERGYVERPARISAIMKGLAKLPHEVCDVPLVGEEVLRTIHAPDYVSFLQNAADSLGEHEVVYPEVFPLRVPERRPRGAVWQAGYYGRDAFTPLSKGAYRAARSAVNAAVGGANLLLAGERLVYAVCRPPGHHAEKRLFGGFCYFCNAAAAAQTLLKGGRSVILDLDFHHGNGQQDIFYDRADVMTISIHGHPNQHYPHFAGFADERGVGAGEGCNLNLPLKAYAGEEAYLAALDKAIRAIRTFDPAFLIIALGFDAMIGDPTGHFGLTPASFGTMAGRLAALKRPILVVQEGGYTLRNLTRGANAFFTTLLQKWYE